MDEERQQEGSPSEASSDTSDGPITLRAHQVIAALADAPPLHWIFIQSGRWVDPDREDLLKAILELSQYLATDQSEDDSSDANDPAGRVRRVVFQEICDSVQKPRYTGVDEMPHQMLAVIAHAALQLAEHHARIDLGYRVQE